MNIFGKYVRKYGIWFVVALLFLMMESGVDLLMPTLLASMIDKGIAVRRMPVVVHYGLLMLLITAFGAVGASMRNVISSWVSQRFGAELRSDLFRKIMALSYEHIDHLERATLITRLTNDITLVQNFANGIMRIFAKAPILAAGSVIMAVRLNAGLSLVFAVVIPLVAGLILLNLRVGFPRFMRVQQALDAVNRNVREYLAGVRVVKAFNRFDYEVEKFDATNEEYARRSVRVLRLMSFFNPALMLAVNFGIVAVLLIGAFRINGGRLQVGVVVAFVNYMTQILFSLLTISMVFNMFIRARASAVRIGEVFGYVDGMGWKEKAELPSGQTGGRIEFSFVSFSYGGEQGTQVLQDISFACEPGQIVGIIGSTGSGKSTLVSLIPRFYDVQSGSIRIDGVDIRDLDPRKLRERMAVVPQKSVLFSGTILENMRWGKADATREEIEAACKLAQAHDFIAALPQGYETRLGQRGVNLSGGQKQRLSIARALLRQPRILILDDCTSAVDMVTEGRIKEALATLPAVPTRLLIAQRITSVADADQIIVMDQGRIAAIGSHRELLDASPIYREIYDSQIGREVEALG